MAAADLCEREPTRGNAIKAKEIANAAADAAYAADAGSRDSVLASFCEHVVGILIEMKAPGCQWLGLTVIEREADGLPV